ncbi:MAG: RDD family protein [Bacilli bacterium]|nr:RDD family protein [Bacilli bacterium]
MDRSKIEKMTSINEAHIVRRLIAAILDALLGIFLFFLLSMTAMTAIANKAFGYSDLHQVYARYQTASHLYMYQQANNDGSVSLIEVKDYEKEIDPEKDSKIISIVDIDTETPSYVLEHIRYYYLSFLTGENIEVPESVTREYDIVKDNLVDPNYDKALENGQLPKEFYTEEYFSKEILKVESDGQYYFDVDENFKASIKEGVDETAVMKYIKNVGYSAQKGLYYADYMQAMNKRAKWIQVFIFVPPYVLVMCLEYLLVPMLFKNGETLGKKTMHICLLAKDGYAIKKRQVIFRFLVFFVEISLSLFVVGVGMMSFVTGAVGVLILFAATLISKTNRSPHDYAAATVVIDERTSVFFESPLSEKQHVDAFNENISSLNEYNEIGKNVIQVGGEIIDPELKKEIESKRKEK